MRFHNQEKRFGNSIARHARFGHSVDGRFDPRPLCIGLRLLACGGDCRKLWAPLELMAYDIVQCLAFTNVKDELRFDEPLRDRIDQCSLVIRHWSKSARSVVAAPPRPLILRQREDDEVMEMAA